MLETVQIGPWETTELGTTMNTSTFKIFDMALSDEQRFAHFRRLHLGFSALRESPPRAPLVRSKHSSQDCAMQARFQW
jgi:hypothetical protein